MSGAAAGATTVSGTLNDANVETGPQTADLLVVDWYTAETTATEYYTAETAAAEYYTAILEANNT